MTGGISTAVLSAIHEGVDQLGGLSEKLSRDRRSIVKAVQVLKGRDLVRIVAPDQFDKVFCAAPATRYELTEAGREWAESGVPVNAGQGERPRKKTAGLRECAWWELRAHGVTTLHQILMTHATGAEKAADINLYKWLVALERAAILARHAKRVAARQSSGRVQWRLVLDLGILAPVWRQKAQEVYDPNSGKVFAMRRPEAKEEGDE